MHSKLTCGQALVRLLVDYGIDTAFGIPGVHTLELYRGLADSNMRHVLVRHEQGASFMADGFARATGRPATCFLITGPGLTNAATGIGQAYSDSKPMLVISTCNARRQLHKGQGRLHETRDQKRIVEPITAFSQRALSSADVPELVAQAFCVFKSGRPRPVHIEIPIDVMAEQADGDWIPHRSPARPGPSVDAIAEAAGLLKSAKRPVVLIGGGAAQTGVALTALIEYLDMPVVTSVAGKGIVSEEHPLALGCGLSLEHIRDYIFGADVVLAIGTELAETDSWGHTLPIAGKLIRIDIDPFKMADCYRAIVPVVADARHAVENLLVAIKELMPRPKTRPDQPSDLVKLKTKTEKVGGALGVQHRGVIGAIQRALPDDALIFTDMTQVAYSGNYMFCSKRPGVWQFPFGYGTLGFALPAAIGAKIGAPTRSVVSISGDGGFLYTMQEMATAAELKLPVVQILWNNDALAQIRDGMDERGIERVGVTPKNPDYIALARSFNWKAERVRSLSDLRDFVRDGVVSDGPCLVEVQERGGDWAIG